MSSILPFVVIGLTSGALYGLAGVGLVITYKSSGVFNFAHGALASLGAYGFYELRIKRGLPWPIAAFICVVVVGPALGVGLERLGRELAKASSAMRVVATVGLLLLVQGTLQQIYGATTLPFDRFLPDSTFVLADVVIGWDQVITVALTGTATIALVWFFRFSRLGSCMRASVDDPELLELSGTSAVLVRRMAWTIGSTFAVVSGILIAPSLGLDVNLLTLLVVQAFGAAALGRFENIGLTFAGGLIIGVGASISQRYVGDISWLVGLPASLPFLVLFVALLVRRSPPVSERLGIVRASADEATGAVKSLRWAVPIAVACLVPFVVGARLPVYTQGLVFVLVFLSLSLLVGTSGQVSLCHAGFVAVGGATFAHFASAGLPWGVALVAAGLVTAPIGAAVAVPAIRLSGVYLALATFGFGILLQRMVYGSSFMFGSFGFRPAPRPSLPGLDLTSDRQFYFVALVIVAAAAGAVWWITQSRLGKLLRAMSDSAVGLEATGVSVSTVRVLVFSIAAFLAGAAGALFSAATGAADRNSYDAFTSLVWLALLAVCGRGTLRPSVIAAVTLTILPAYIERDIAQIQLMLFGGAAILAAVMSSKERGDTTRLDHAIATANSQRNPFAARSSDDGWRPPTAARAGVVVP